MITEEVMSELPKVSVIVPVFNSENYIVKCINSLTKQTLKDIEIIVIDDGSSDKSFELLQELARYDKRIYIYQQTSSGVSAARNYGLKKARGEYIGFCDSDDWSENSMYEIMYNEAKKNSADIVFCGIYKNESEKNKPYFEDGRYDRKNIEDRIFPYLVCNIDEKSGLRTLSGSVCSKLFSSDFVHQNQLLFHQELSYNEDLLFCMEATIKAQTYCYIGSEHLYHVRRNIISATKRYSEKYWCKHKVIPQYLRNICGQYPIFDSQIDKYTFEIAVAAIRNEAKRLSIKTFLPCCKEVIQIITDKDLKNAVKGIDEDLLFKTNKAYLYTVKYRLSAMALLLGLRDWKMMRKDLEG